MRRTEAGPPCRATVGAVSLCSADIVRRFMRGSLHKLFWPAKATFGVPVAALTRNGPCLESRTRARPLPNHSFRNPLPTQRPVRGGVAPIVGDREPQRHELVHPCPSPTGSRCHGFCLHIGTRFPGEARRGPAELGAHTANDGKGNVVRAHRSGGTEQRGSQLSYFLYCRGGNKRREAGVQKEKGFLPLRTVPWSRV